MIRLTILILGFVLVIASPISFAQQLLGGSGPEQLMDPCLSQAEANATISTNKDIARIFDKDVLAKIIKNNKDATSKLNQIREQRILVLPVSHLGLEDRCDQGIQVYFTFVDSSNKVRNYLSE